MMELLREGKLQGCEVVATCALPAEKERGMVACDYCGDCNCKRTKLLLTEAMKVISAYVFKDERFPATLINSKNVCGF